MKTRPPLQHPISLGLGIPKALQAASVSPGYRVAKSPYKKPSRRSSFESLLSSQTHLRKADKKSKLCKNKKKKPKKPKHPEHPLSEAFGESVDSTTSLLASRLPPVLNEKLQLLLTGVANQSSEDATLLKAAAKTKEKFAQVLPLTPEFALRIEESRKFLEEKQLLLGKLWQQWEDSARAIRMLEKEVEEAEDNSNKSSERKENSLMNLDGEDEEDDIEGGEWHDEIRGVGKKWVATMEVSEMKLVEEEKKKRQLAVSAML